MALDNYHNLIVEESYKKEVGFEMNPPNLNERENIEVEVKSLKDLIKELHKVFESDSVNVEYVHALMSAYKSNPADWKKYAKFDRFRENIVVEVKSLKDLIKELHKVFESDSVNVEYVHALMSAYKSNPADWKKYAKFDRFRYTRNLVDEGNGKFNLMILCWGEGHGSAIHDHADSHCFMKMLEGELSEVRFEWPKESKEDNTSVMKEVSRAALLEDSVCYINDSMGLHRVENPSHSNVAVSLHLYCPPFDTCSVFNQQTGQRSKAAVTFWSVYGHRKNKSFDEENRDPEDN